MKLGVRAHDYPKMTAPELAALLRREGFQAAQLAIPKSIEGIEGYDDINDAVIEEIKAAFAENGLDIAVLSCYRELSAIDADGARAEAELFGKMLRFCKRLGAGMVGTETTWLRLAPDEREGYYPRALDLIKRIAEKAEEADAMLGIEPASMHTVATPELTARLIEEVGSDKLCIIFDPVNMLSPATIAEQEKLYRDCVAAFGGRIRALHFKDCRLEGGEIRECPIGEGVVEYDWLYGWLRQHCPEAYVLREGLYLPNKDGELAVMRRLTGIV